ncbi:MAG: hypothetical protein PF904_09610 [Kiritimatiellae bacterium]|nr:hypothetical protein [Kiritimatiellia bacterium]
MKNMGLWLFLVTATVAFAFSVKGEVVRIELGDNSATASTSYPNRQPKYAVNGAGLTGDQHTATGGDNVSWLSSNLSILSNQWFLIDLGAIAPLHHVKVWNFNWNHATVDTEKRGVKDVAFYVSTAPTLPAPDFTNSVLWTLVTNTTFAIAPGLDTYAGEPDVSLHGAEGRWLAMKPLTNHGGDDYAGISEIQVFAEADFPGKYHMDAALSGYSGSSTLSDFPCVLRLSEDLPGFKYSTFSSPDDGGDLRITDIYGHQLLYEIEKWDPSGTSVVWVAVADLVGTTSEVKLHWNDVAASTPDYATNGTFWASSYGGVWHLDQTAAVDSTTNRNVGTAHGNITASGILGAGQYFGGNDYISVADDASIGANVTNALTLSTWFKSEVTLVRTNEVHRLLEKGDCYYIAGGYSSLGGVTFLMKDNNEVHGIGNGAEVASNEWHLVSCTYDGARLLIFMDGVFKGERIYTGSIDDDKLSLRIGSDDESKSFKGILDETRIESVVRSPDWIKACYDSQREAGDFVEYSAVYPASPSGTMIFLQ